MEKHHTNRAPKRYLEFFIPLTLLLAMSVVFRVTGLDLIISGKFYSPDHGWFLAQHSPWHILYRYGTFPALAIGGASLIGILFSLIIHRLKPHRATFVFLLCALLIGPGLIVNLCFKDHWGRPRPREIVPFQGSEHFVPVLEKGRGDGNSFPSGHASMGFYLMLPYFLLRKNHPRTGMIILGSGLGYGVLMGYARIVQGGHFASDIMWSAGFVYLSGLVLSWLLKLDGSPRPSL